jgi:alpha-L-fucosidase
LEKTQKEHFMKKSVIVLTFILLFSLSISAADNTNDLYLPNWESLKTYEIPEWYKDAKFGIFIHWGVYSVPAFGNEWYPRNMYQQGSKEYIHHIKTYGKQSEFGYKDFIPMFTAANYDPAAWAELFKKAGARYVVPVAEHHDGFPLYDCSLSEWDAVDKGPKRDLIGDLAKAVRDEGLIFGVSSHRAEHWWFFEGGRQFDSDVQDEAYDGLYGPAMLKNTNPNKEFLDDWLARTSELVEKYQPQLVWFDWWIEEPAFELYKQKFASYYYNKGLEWDKGVVINYKKEAFPIEAAAYDIERGQLAEIRYPLWQTDTAVAKNSWGYTENNDYKTVNSLVEDLIDIVSKNGVLLLNIGPKPDGTIPQEDQDVLLGIGQWLSVNGDAIYDTRPWKVFGEGPTKIVEGTFNDVKRAGFTADDIRFTTKDGKLYAILLDWPANRTASIKSLASSSELCDKEIADVKLLGSDSKLKWSQKEDALSVKLPKKQPCEHAFVLEISFK